MMEKPTLLSLEPDYLLSLKSFRGISIVSVKKKLVYLEEKQS